MINISKKIESKLNNGAKYCFSGKFVESLIIKQFIAHNVYVPAMFLSTVFILKLR